jgi:hypothetical protein
MRSLLPWRETLKLAHDDAVFVFNQHRCTPRELIDYSKIGSAEIRYEGIEKDRAMGCPGWLDNSPEERWERRVV